MNEVTYRVDHIPHRIDLLLDSKSYCANLGISVQHHGEGTDITVDSDLMVPGSSMMDFLEEHGSIVDDDGYGKMADPISCRKYPAILCRDPRECASTGKCVALEPEANPKTETAYTEWYRKQIRAEGYQQGYLTGCEAGRMEERARHGREVAEADREERRKHWSEGFAAGWNNAVQYMEGRAGK